MYNITFCKYITGICHILRGNAQLFETRQSGLVLWIWLYVRTHACFFWLPRIPLLLLAYLKPSSLVSPCFDPLNAMQMPFI